MRKLLIPLAVFTLAASALAQDLGNLSGLMSKLVEPQDYVLKRVSSYDRSGGNADTRWIGAGETLTVFEEAGPGVITHFWFTISSPGAGPSEEVGFADVLGQRTDAQRGDTHR